MPRSRSLFWIFSVYLALFGLGSVGYVVPLSRCAASIAEPARSATKLNMFNFFGVKGQSKETSAPPTTATATAAAKVDKAKVELLKQNLEKISNKQKRDYAAEEAAKKPVPKLVTDKQDKSYNFGKSNEFPNLYKGWIRKEGDQIAKQMIGAVKASIAKGEKNIEVLFDPVPNLDEVAFGTVWNQKLRLEVAAELKVPDYACNRGGPSTLEWSNLYWANRLISGLGSKNAVLLTISEEGLVGQFKPTFSNGAKLVSYSQGRKSLKPGDTSLVILLSPFQESQYREAEKLSVSLGVPVVALNSPYSFRYDVGGGKPWTLSYVMKRIPKGWIFRTYPGKFECVIEGPAYEIFRADQFDEQPSLPAISKVSMQASTLKFGAGGNDRIFQNRL